MSNYVESKKVLDKIRNEYGCKGDIIFRTAIQYVVEFGQVMFEDEEWVNGQVDRIDAKHDTAESEGRHLWMTRGFEKACIKCAVDVAEVNTYDLLIYIQKEVFWSHEGGLDYARAIELLQTCMNWFVDYDCGDNAEMRQHFEDLDFTEEELIALEFGWLFEEEEN